MTTFNQTNFETIQTLQQFKTSIDVIIQQNDQYIQSINRHKNKDFTIKKENKTLEEQKLNTETLLDKLIEIETKNDLFVQQIDEFIDRIKHITNEIENMKKECLKEKEIYESKKNVLEHFILQVLDEMKQKALKEHDEQRERIEKEYDSMINHNLQSFYSHFDSSILNLNEIIHLEKWTRKKCGEILFDSQTDNWNFNSSIFENKVKGKRNVSFIVEDDQCNKYGYYFDSTPIEINRWMKNKNSFLFSFKINGKFNENGKYEEKDASEGLFVGNKSNEWIIHINWGFWIKKQNISNPLHVSQHSDYFNYHNVSNALHHDVSHNSGKDGNLKRFIVIQMK